MDAWLAVWARWDPGFSGNAEVDVLYLEVAQEDGQFAIAAVLHVVGGYLEEGGRLGLEFSWRLLRLCSCLGGG